jgi:hypothetical protein
MTLPAILSNMSVNTSTGSVVMRNNSLLSKILVQVFVVCQNSSEESMGLLCNDWLNGLDRFAWTKVSGNMLAIGTEARPIAEKDQCLVVPNQFPTHLKDRAFGIDRARLIELVHNVGRVKYNYWLPEKRNMNNSTWPTCMSKYS